MGALGASYLAKEFRDKTIAAKGSHTTKFRGFDVLDIQFKSSSFNCKGCPNQCEIVQIGIDPDTKENGTNGINGTNGSNGFNGTYGNKDIEIVARWGDRCGKWEVF
jgi:hypothetical protein